MKLTADIVAGFSQSLLQKNYDHAVASPACHMEWWELACSDESKVAIAAPRRHAKSTAITLAYTLAAVLFRNKNYVLIVSDTITQATQFLQEIKKELTDNERVINLFKISKFIKDTEEDIIVECADGHQFRLAAKGSGQGLRGLKWDNKRPDLIVGDDLENDEIVMNKERRTKFKRWFYGALVPSLSVTGHIRIVGTILHEDSLLNTFMPKEYKSSTVVGALKSYSKLKYDPGNPWKSVKYRAHTDDFTQILWPERYSAEWFLKEKADFYAMGLPDVYSQEYLNIPIDESVSYFKRVDFIAQTKEDRLKPLHYYIAADLAISKEEQADWSVFMVVGMDENRIIHVKDVIRERLDGREIVDTILALQRAYEPDLFGIEEMQVSKAIGPFLREEMIATNTYINLVKLKHGGKDKIARAKSIQGRMRAHAVRFDKAADWYPNLEDELSKFPRGTNDDQVDAFAYIGMMLDSLVEAPTQQELEEDEYEYERNASGLNDAGRSTFTGY